MHIFLAFAAFPIFVPAWAILVGGLIWIKPIRRQLDKLCDRIVYGPKKGHSDDTSKVQILAAQRRGGDV